MRAIVTLRVVREADRGWLRGQTSAWPQDLLDAAEALRMSVEKCASDKRRLKLRGHDFEQFYFPASDKNKLPQDDDAPRWVPPFQPDRRDFAVYLEHLAWWSALARLASKPPPETLKKRRDGLPADPDQRIVWWAASGFSFHQIGKQEGCDANTIDRRYRAAMRDCWRIANGWARLR